MARLAVLLVWLQNSVLPFLHAYGVVKPKAYLGYLRQFALPQLKLRVLNVVLDGRFRRFLEGQRQKLDPWGSWMHSTYLDASTGHPEWREGPETRTVVPQWRELPDGRKANLIVSDTGIDNAAGERLHVPMFDIDLPMRVVPSTNPGKGHLYINKPMPWHKIVVLLQALVDVGIVHRNYKAHSVERVSTGLRPAFVRKPAKGWTSDTDTPPFPDFELPADSNCVPQYAKRSFDVVTVEDVIEDSEPF